MAPEVLLDGETYSEACDIYSAGVVLWEAVQSTLPYYHQAKAALKRDPEFHVLDALLTERLSPKITEDALDHPLDPRCAQLMEACWSRAPERRPSITELRSKLEVLIAKEAEVQELRTEHV